MSKNLGRSPSPNRRTFILLAGSLLVVVAAVVAWLTWPAGPAAPTKVPLSQVISEIADGKVTSARLDDGTATIQVDVAGGATQAAHIPAGYTVKLTDQLVAAHVKVTAATSGQTSTGADLAMRIVPILLILGLMVWAVQKATPNGMLGARRKKALTTGEIPRVTFADVAGADEAVAQLQEMVEFLRTPERFTRVGATPPRGGLLVGPPGTGKTLLARAVAGEAKVPFFALAGSDFVETFVGLGARRVRDLFAEARKSGRAIIFIDEIDAVGRTRSSEASHGGEGERENTLISLLSEMDGFADSQVIVLAATNRADTLDPALTRPGRLDRQIQVPNPDRRGRTRILEVHAAGRPIAGDVDFVALARQTPGMSGADLAHLVNEACMEAARRELLEVDADCFQAAVATVAMGRARVSALVTEFDRSVTAWHEAGHTLAAAVLPDADDPVSVTIVPRGPAGGVTWMSGNDDLFLTRAKAIAQLTVSLAGRAAEEVLMGGQYTQGAAGDLQAATSLATKMVTQYAMTEFGYTQVDADTLRVGGKVAAQAHAHIELLLQEAHEAAVQLLAEYRGDLERLAQALLAEETLSGEQIQELLAQHA